MALDRADITDRHGRHIPVVRRKLPEDAVVAQTSRPKGPRNGAELADILQTLIVQVNRLDTSELDRRAEISGKLKRLAAWAAQAT